ncbi:uncharacterized protein LOC141911931 [Tubulanus polymorphus]|uniref:uncharacterized protein LOC141911931 n=1 Tax=Tubulanus polymorphus TaxID=672921 RepID=UPI003DA25CCD
MDDDECPTIAVFADDTFASKLQRTATTTTSAAASASADDDAVIVLDYCTSPAATTATRTMAHVNMQASSRGLPGPPPLVRIPVAQPAVAHTQTATQAHASIPNLQPMTHAYVNYAGTSVTSAGASAVQTNDSAASLASLNPGGNVLQLREHVIANFNQFKCEKKYKEGLYFLDQVSRREPRLQILCNHLSANLMKQIQQAQGVGHSHQQQVAQQTQQQQQAQRTQQQQVAQLQQQQQLRLQQQGYLVDSATNRILAQPASAALPDYATALRQCVQSDQIQNRQIISEFQKRLAASNRQQADQSQQQQQQSQQQQQQQQRAAQSHSQQQRLYQSLNSYQLPQQAPQQPTQLQHAPTQPTTVSSSFSSILHQQLQQSSQYASWQRQQTERQQQPPPPTQQQQHQQHAGQYATSVQSQHESASRQQQQQQQQHQQLLRQQQQQNQVNRQAQQKQAQHQQNSRQQQLRNDMLLQQRLQKHKDSLKSMMAQQQQKRKQAPAGATAQQAAVSVSGKTQQIQKEQTSHRQLMNQKYAVFNVTPSRRQPITQNYYKPSLNVGTNCFTAFMRIKEYSEEDNRSEIVERERREQRERLEAERLEQERMARENKQREHAERVEATRREMLKLAEEIVRTRNEIERATRNNIAELTNLNSEEIASEPLSQQHSVLDSAVETSPILEDAADTAADNANDDVDDTVDDVAVETTASEKDNPKAETDSADEPGDTQTVPNNGLDMSKVIMDSVRAIQAVIDESANPSIASGPPDNSAGDTNATTAPMSPGVDSNHNCWLCCPICKSLNVNFFSCSEKNMLQHIMVEHGIQDVECANSFVTAIEFPKCTVRLNRLPLTNGNNVWRVSDGEDEYDYCEEDFYEIECQYCDTIFVRKATYNRHVRGCRKKAIRCRRQKEYKPPAASRTRRTNSKDTMNSYDNTDYEDSDDDDLSSIISESSDMNDFIVPDDYVSGAESRASSSKRGRGRPRKKCVNDALKLYLDARKKRSKRQTSNSSEVSSNRSTTTKRHNKKRKLESDDDLGDFKKAKRRKKRKASQSSEKSHKRIIRPLDSSSDDSEDELTLSSAAARMNGRSRVTARVKTYRSSSTTTKEADKENLKNKTSSSGTGGTANGDCLERCAPLKLTISVGGKQGPTIDLNPKRDVKTPPIKIKFSDLRSPYASAELTSKSSRR